MILRNAILALALVATGPAFAQDHGGGHHPADHGNDHHAADHHDDGHQAQGQGSDGHGDAHGDDADGGGHHDDPTEFYLDDDDGDGTKNWLDSSYDGTERGFWDLFGDADDPYMVPDLGFHALHIFLLIVLLVVVGRRPIGDALKNRALGIRKELVDSARERDEARQKNEELVARLGKFERELEEMRVTAAEDAKQDAARIVERAEAEAKRIAESSERSISEETRRAKASLRKEAVDLAVQLAETTLSKEVQADDQRRLARQFLDTLTTDGDSAHG